ncbi:MAG: radical SAM protein [Candidatus Thermoplasmatota archaeon]|nr:radical SAM protein [Candidatus Thermoplasmatota archaeon]
MKSSESNTSKYSFEIGPIRPPNEGGESSLLIRPTRNCSWNRCAFCPYYDGKKFRIRDVEDIKKDIDAVERIKEMLKENSDAIGKVPFDCRSVVSGWMQSGEKTAFLQDSNSLIMPTEELIDLLEYLVETFPSLERITSYARSDAVLKKEMEELEKIRSAGLKRLHIGLESGDDNVLKSINKGVTSEEHIRAGKKAMKAGFEVSEYVMPGLGGDKFSREHALNTAKVLNQIDPDYIRVRPLSVYPNTELYQKIERDDFQLNSILDRLREVKIIVENLEVSSNLCFDHSWNSWRDRDGNLLFDMDYEGYRLPEKKDHILQRVKEGLEINE